MMSESPQSLTLSLFYASVITLAIHLKKCMHDVVIVGDNLSAFLADAILHKHGHKTIRLMPLCTKTSYYTIYNDGGCSIEDDFEEEDIIEHIPLVDQPCALDTFAFTTPPILMGELEEISKHTQIPIKILMQTLEQLLANTELFTERDKEDRDEEDRAKEDHDHNKEDCWEEFAEDVHIHNLIRGSITSHSHNRRMYVDLDRVYCKRLPDKNYIAVYEGDKLLCLSKRVIWTLTEQPKCGDIIVGEYIHQEDFVSSGDHFAAGNVQNHYISLFHEDTDLWIRIWEALFYVDQHGIHTFVTKDFDPHQVLDYFRTTDDTLVLDLHSLALAEPRSFTSREGVYHLHPFHLPKIHARWLAIMVLSLIIARQK